MYPLPISPGDDSRRKRPLDLSRALSLAVGIHPTVGWQAVVAACVVAAVLIFCQLPAPAADSSTSGPSLSKLEVKFFQHDYPTDTMASRLERLEKMVFGEIRSGSDYDRLSNLLAAVPNLNPKVGGDEQQEPDIPGSGSAGGEKGSAGSGRQTATQPQDSVDERNYIPPEGSKYPAVTAIESRVLGKDFASEPIAKRLDRLETKLFGRPSTSTDLMDRVDRIKQRAGIDIARQAPAGSDWAEEDDGSDYTSEPTASGEDGGSFSGRDLRQDMRRAFGIPPGGGLTDRYSNNGSYGMGATGGGGGGSYQAPNPPSRSTMPSYGGGGAPAPAPAPPRQARNQVPQPAMGLNDQVGALEQEIFGRGFRDPLPARLNRLESTVFPQEKPAIDKSLPERVSRLLAVIPLSRQPRQVAQNKHVDDLDQDLDDLGAPAPRPAPQRGGGGLSKIINSISGFLSGGYPMGGAGGLITDPQTGLLYDGLTGNLIDPVTGVVVGQRLSPGAGIGGGFGSFGSGFSRYGAVPYGIGSGSSMRFGVGGMGGLGGFGLGF